MCPISLLFHKAYFRFVWKFITTTIHNCTLCLLYRCPGTLLCVFVWSDGRCVKRRSMGKIMGWNLPTYASLSLGILSALTRCGNSNVVSVFTLSWAVPIFSCRMCFIIHNIATISQLSRGVNFRLTNYP